MWSAEHAAVWHLGEEAEDGDEGAVHVDSTPHALHGRQQGNAAVDGMIGRGQRFDASDSIVIDDPGGAWSFADGGLDADRSDLTISAWVYDEGGLSNYAAIAWKGGYAEAGYEFNDHASDQHLDIFFRDSGDDEENIFGAPIVGWPVTWHHVVVTLERGPDADRGLFYVDGMLNGGYAVATLVGRSISGTADFQIGAGFDGRDLWRGIIDELRISSVARSADWIAVEHASGTDRLITYGAPQMCL